MSWADTPSAKWRWVLTGDIGGDLLAVRLLAARQRMTRALEAEVIDTIDAIPVDNDPPFVTDASGPMTWRTRR